MRHLVLLLSFFIVSSSLWGQTESSISEAPPSDDGAVLVSPRSTVFTHLKFLQTDNYEPEIAAKVFNLNDEPKAKDLSIKLKQILDAEGLYVDLDVIPENPNYKDSITGLHRYILFPKFPQIFVEKVNGKWYYSRRTAEAIPELHNQVFPLGTDFFVGLFPSIGQKEVFGGLKAWQLIGIFILVIIGVVFHRVLTLVLEFFINRLAKYFTQHDSQVEIVHSIARPLSYMVITILAAMLVPSLMLPIMLAKILLTLLNILTPIFGTYAVYKFVDLIGYYMMRMADKTDTTLDDQLVPLVRKSLKIFVVVVGLLVVLQNLDVNVTALLAGISIGGLAFALAAQDTIKNLFGSLMIFLDRPFQIGDWINFDGRDGTVEEVGFRSTRVRTFANSLISIPNGRIADMTIDNLGLRVYRRFSTSLTVTYDTPPPLLDAFVEGLRQLVEKHPDTRKDYYHVYVNNLGPHSIDIIFYVFFELPDWGLELKARHHLIMGIIELAEELGVRFAFPTQTIHVEDLPGQNTLSPKYDLDPESMKRKTAAFIERKSKEINGETN